MADILISSIAGRPRREHKAPTWLAKTYGDFGDVDSGYQVDGLLTEDWQAITFSRESTAWEGGAELSRLRRGNSVGEKRSNNKRKVYRASFEDALRLPSRLAERTWSSQSRDTADTSPCEADSPKPTKRFRQYCADNPFAAQAAAASLLAGAAWIEAVQALAAAKLHSGISASKKSSGQHGT